MAGFEPANVGSKGRCLKPLGYIPVRKYKFNKKFKKIQKREKLNFPISIFTNTVIWLKNFLKIIKSNNCRSYIVDNNDIIVTKFRIYRLEMVIIPNFVFVCFDF